MDLEKFEHGKMRCDQGITTNAPILLEVYVAYECKTIDRNAYGDYDWFVGEIQFYRYDELFLGNGFPNFEKLEIPLYIGRSKYTRLDGDSSFHTYWLECKSNCCHLYETVI